jgi:hypothetical protein
MMPFRRARIVIATVWLLCQAVGVMAAPVTFLVTAGGELECTCLHGDHAICPMHHRRPPDASHTRCAMQGTDDTAAVVLSTLLGGAAALMPSASVFIGPPPDEPVRPQIIASTSLRPAPPDPPPPRS